jgi:transcriptional regulator with XRE-family HTH domain
MISSKSDIGRDLFNVLRKTRLNRQLSQQELARKLGMRQRQISDLERAAMDPRLSTIRNVARALDLEVVVIPRHLISAVEGLQRAGTDAAKRPMYALGDADADAESDAGDPSPVELATGGESEFVSQRRRRTKEPQ